jgi:hypothetical protein
LDQASFLLKHIEVFAGFVANLTELINFLFQQDKAPKPEPITREDVERISTILEPVAKDSGSQITIAVTGNTGPVTINPVIIRSEKANAVQNGARRFLGPSIPMQGNFERELMYLQQMRGDPKSKVGDRGVCGFRSKPPMIPE